MLRRRPSYRHRTRKNRKRIGTHRRAVQGKNVKGKNRLSLRMCQPRRIPQGHRENEIRGKILPADSHTNRHTRSLSGNRSRRKRPSPGHCHEPHANVTTSGTDYLHLHRRRWFRRSTRYRRRRQTRDSRIRILFRYLTGRLCRDLMAGWLTSTGRRRSPETHQQGPEKTRPH